MYYNTLIIEKGNRNVGLRWSVILHSLLFLLAWMYYFKVEVKDPDPEKPYKVKIELDFKESSLSKYAHADVGAQRPKTEEIKLLAPKLQAQVIQEIKKELPVPKPVLIPTVVTTPPKTAEVVVEESPVVVTQSDIQIEQPKFEDVPVRPNPPKPQATEAPAPVKPAASPSPAGGGGSGTNTAPASTADGNGSGKGNAGSGPGKTSGNDGTEGVGKTSDGTGKFDGSGRGIFGRQATDTNRRGFPILKDSRTSIKVCVDRLGNVTFAEIIEKETTITDQATLKKYLKGAWGMKFQPDATAPVEECGKVVWNTKNSTLPFR